ncbi:hypothetical protein EYD10_11081 [Varanus komodoensis]|nr:hypothetical protein EYD10_11081 [Varanus komodoensis]
MRMGPICAVIQCSAAGERARICLIYLVNQLANMEHSFHHILLLEIKHITDTFPNILGIQSRGIYRMSNSFTAIAKLLIQQLENDPTSESRVEDVAEIESPSQLDDLKSIMNGNEEDEKLQVKIQAFGEKINIDSGTPGSVRRYSLGQVSKEERKDMRFSSPDGEDEYLGPAKMPPMILGLDFLMKHLSLIMLLKEPSQQSYHGSVGINCEQEQVCSRRAILDDLGYLRRRLFLLSVFLLPNPHLSRSKSLALHAVRMKDIHLDNGQEMDNGDVTAGISFTDIYLSQEADKLPSSTGTEESQLEQSSLSHPSIKCTEPENLPEPFIESCHEGSLKTIKNPVEYQDKLYFHLKENLSKVKAYVMEMGKKIPLPDECVIEDTVRSCVAKVFFSCPLKGHYCLYSKSSFTLISQQPQLWIHIMFLFQQNSYKRSWTKGSELDHEQPSGGASSELESKRTAEKPGQEGSSEGRIREAKPKDQSGTQHRKRAIRTIKQAKSKNGETTRSGDQSLFPDPLSMQNNSVQALKTLWEKTQLKGTHSFETAMVQSTFPHQKDLDHIQIHLEEVRFFDLFGYSEETGAWQCFMCNNPEKATVVNQDGQPLIEGKLKEKQVRWKFIKRWKTRYFTLAGNQLLFRKGKSDRSEPLPHPSVFQKDDPDDCPIELSKVQSVKVVAKKRRDRSLPRAFEIFTDSKTYVFKAKDEKNAEEWLQCINVAVAQAKERESREVTTYL